MPSASTTSVRADDHPQSSPCTSASTISPRPRVNAITPGTSRWRPAFSSRVSRVARAVHRKPRASGGTPIQNTQRHDNWSTSTPPTSGPIASATAETPAQIPRARGRSSSEKAELTSASESVSIPAAPTPWMTRATTSTSIDGASAATTRPPEKIASATRKTRLRPTMSPSRPAVTTKTATVSR